MHNSNYFTLKKKEPKSKPQFDMQEKCAALTFIHSEINN